MTNYQPAFARLDEFVERCLAEDGTPGVVLALTDRVRLLRVATYGYADLAARTPVGPDHLFEIGSIGKSFTSIALLQLREAGRLELHAPVADYLPWFRVRSEHSPITAHHLLSHTAGVITGTDFAPDARYQVWALRDTVATEPGVRFQYSNLGYKALGLLLTDLTGQDYAEIIRARILDPLGMAATDPIIANATRLRLATGHSHRYDDRPPHPSHGLVPATWLETDTADGCLASTAADMAAYVRMLLNRGAGPQGRLLSEESFALLTQRVIAVPEWGEETFYGYGLSTSEVEGHTYVGHGGGMPGYVSAIRADLDDGLGIAVLLNGPGRPTAIARTALQLLRAAHHDQDLPPLPSARDRHQVERAADYAGVYRCGERTLTLEADGERLLLHHDDGRIPLEPRGADAFYVDHPDFALYLLRFGREAGEGGEDRQDSGGDGSNEGNQPGKVVEAFHGPEWYVGDGHAGPTAFDYPPEWDTYVGHYRSFNPWVSNFRVLKRKGRLLLVAPTDADGLEGDTELVPLAPGEFRVGEDERRPERVRFDTVVDGQALRAFLADGEFYRFFTP
jgi:D-alanyl-D-alanine carboxypeptidase